MMDNKNKLYLDWSRYLNLIDQLYNKINWKKEKFSVIISVNRGGSIPGVILSHKANLPLVVLNKGGIIYEREKFLVVDDVIHTGSTLENIDYLAQGPRLEYHPLAYANKDYKIATLYRREGTKVEPNYFVETTNKWVVFPYEQE
jgi:hypoxanthine phosphoribosyltransferase